MSRAFDHRDAGTRADAWTRLADALPEVPAPERGDHLVVLAAHPDDETLGAGGLIALAAAAGAAITVVVATDGAASHPHSPTHTPAELGACRRREVAAAISTLAPAADVQLLGLPDGRLAEYQPRLVAALTRAAAGCTFLVTPWVGDGHPDHEACGRAGRAVEADHHWQYPIWAWHWADPDADDLPAARLRGVRLDPPARAAKETALACHVSQHRPLSDATGDEAILGPDLLEHFRRDVEAFVVDAPETAGLVSRPYFDELYRHADDPWGLHDRFYEARKRAAVLAALPRPRFRRAFEPGCATGLLTRELAARCDELIACDIAGAAVDQAAARLAGAAHVSVRPGAIPDAWPDGRFDLIVLSEVGYYCTDLSALAARVEESLSDDGVLLACHWRHPAPMHPHGADAVHAALGHARHLVVSHVEADFLLQVWTRTGGSVARAEGIVR